MFELRNVYYSGELQHVSSWYSKRMCIRLRIIFGDVAGVEIESPRQVHAACQVYARQLAEKKFSRSAFLASISIVAKAVK